MSAIPCRPLSTTKTSTNAYGVDYTTVDNDIVERAAGAHIETDYVQNRMNSLTRRDSTTEESAYSNNSTSAAITYSGVTASKRKAEDTHSYVEDDTTDSLTAKKTRVTSRNDSEYEESDTYGYSHSSKSTTSPRQGNHQSQRTVKKPYKLYQNRFTTPLSDAPSLTLQHPFPWDKVQAQTIRQIVSATLGIGFVGTKAHGILRLKQIQTHGVENTLKKEQKYRLNKPRAIPKAPSAKVPIDQLADVRRSLRKHAPRQPYSTRASTCSVNKSVIYNHYDSPDISVTSSPTPYGLTNMSSRAVDSENSTHGNIIDGSCPSHVSNASHPIQSRSRSTSTHSFNRTPSEDADPTITAFPHRPNNCSGPHTSTSSHCELAVNRSQSREPATSDSSSKYKEVVALLPGIIPFPSDSKEYIDAYSFVLFECMMKSDIANGIDAAPISVKPSLIRKVLKTHGLLT